jgi:hypothetical protein
MPPVVATQETSRSQQCSVKMLTSRRFRSRSRSRQSTIADPGDRQRCGRYAAVPHRSGMAVEQQIVPLHDPVDPFDVHCRAALFVAPRPEQCIVRR